jgi:hypothetical protein
MEVDELESNGGSPIKNGDAASENAGGEKVEDGETTGRGDEDEDEDEEE